MVTWSAFERHVAHLPPGERTRLHEAFIMGERAHHGQKRKSGEPYFSHPIHVALELAAIGADTDTLIAALLHDALEDTPLTLDEVEAAFGSAVATLVDGVTKLCKADVASRSTLDEQIETLRKMFTVMQTDARIMVIKLIDRLHNMQTISGLKPERRITLAEETRDFYVKIADRLCMQDIRDRLQELVLQVLDPSLHERLLASAIATEDAMASLIQGIAAGLEHHDVYRDLLDIHQEQRTWESADLHHHNISGIAYQSVVFVCNDIDACYRLLGALHQRWRRETLSFQDFINAPQVNGYRGLHSTIILGDGTRVCCKIRTQEMDLYARRGITTRCFDGIAAGLLSYVPWAQHVESLAAETRDRSAEFWETLRNDILGESIMIHGPGDEGIYVPRDATALDGAFYLLREQAVYVQSVHVNGIAVPLAEPLRHANTISVTLASTPCAEREWLHIVNTGYALSLLRASLASSKSPKEQEELGKALLERALQQRKGGFPEEMASERIPAMLAPSGYASMAELYAAIASGRIDPDEAADLLIGVRPATKDVTAKKHGFVLRYALPKGTPQHVFDRLHDVRSRFRDIIVRSKTAVDQRQYRFTLHLMSDIRSAGLFEQALSFAGAEHVEKRERLPAQLALLSTVIVLWALNPVIATMILRSGTPVLTLVTQRLLLTAVFSTVFFGVWYAWHRRLYSPIPHLWSLSMLPTALTFMLATFTYAALQSVPPSIHLTLLRLNVLLLPFLGWLVKYLSPRKVFLPFILLIVTLGLLVQSSYLPAFTGIVFSLCALLTYVLYSLSIERILQRNKIELRYPALLFSTGTLFGAIGLLLLPFQSMAMVFNTSGWLVAIYVLFCVFIPHTCFYALLKKQRFTYVSDLFLAEIPLAALAEFLLLGIVQEPMIYIGMFTIASIILFIRLRQQYRLLI